MRPLGNTGMEVSALGLGTVKLGRDQGVKYPQSFTIPDDASASALLEKAQQLGINLIDTAPAYDRSEQRLGNLLQGQRNNWLICSKVGEEFDNGQSHFDFSPEHTQMSIERSLERLKTDYIDMVLVHCDGNDQHIIDNMGTLAALEDIKKRGLIRAFGMSTKTAAGGIAAAEQSDIVMLTYNLGYRDEETVLDACAKLGSGALIKKALASGHIGPSEQAPLAGSPVEKHEDPVAASMDLIFAHEGTSSAIIGTISLDHLEQNVMAARRSLGLS